MSLFNKTINLIAYAGFAFITTLPVEAIEFSKEELDKTPLSEILKWTDSTFPNTERTILRRYIAEKYPNTEHGLYASAWLAGNVDNNDRRIELLKELYKINPTHNYGPALLSQNLTEKSEKLKTLKAAAYADNLSAFTAELYSKLLSDEDVSRYINELMSNPKTEYMGRFLQSNKYGNPSDSIEVTRPCLNEPNFYCARNFGFYTLVKARNEGLGVNQVIGELRPLIEFADKTRNHLLLVWLGDQLIDDYSEKQIALNFYTKAFEIQATASLASKIFDIYRYTDSEGAVRFLEGAKQILPNNWEIDAKLLKVYWDLNNDTASASKIADGLIEKAYRSYEKKEAAIALANYYNNEGLLDKSYDLLSKVHNQIKNDGYKEALLREMINNREYAQDYAQMKMLLGSRADWNVTFDSWPIGKLRLADLGESYREERERFHNENPFLAKWEREFGTSLTLRLEFETNSAVILKSSIPALDKAADVLKSRAALNYVFLIEGHTDNVGDKQFNKELSLKRAKSVAQYFSAKHGIGRERLNVVGHGMDFPVATNDTSSGRSQNRRVAIAPYGNLAAPSIATSSTTQSDFVQFSPDGRYAAIGATPIQIWDLEKGLKIKDLYSGGIFREFSPSGRYLAVTSQWIDINGRESKSAFIYDVKTGLVHSVIKNNWEVKSFSWSPDEKQIALGDDSQGIRIYDLDKRSIVAYDKKPGAYQASRIAWSKDGKYIIHGIGATAPMQIRNSKNLNVITTLRTSGFPVKVGQSFDGKYTWEVDGANSINIWESSTWKLIHTVRVPRVSFFVVSHPSKHELAMAIGERQDRGITLLTVDLVKGEITNRTTRDVVQAVQYTPDGTQLLVSDGDKVLWLGSEDLKVDKTLEGQTANPVKLIADNDSNQVISQDEKGTRVWSLDTARLNHYFAQPTEMPWQTYDAAKSTYVSVSPNGEVLLMDLNNYTLRKVGRTSVNNVEQLKLTDKYIVFAGAYVPNVSRGSIHTIEVEVFDREKLSSLYSYSVPVEDRAIKRGMTHFGYAEDIAISDKKGVFALATRWMDGYGTSRFSKSQDVRLFDVKTGKLVKRYGRTQDFEELNFVDSNTLKLVEDGGYFRYINIDNGEEEKREERNEVGNVVNVGKGKQLIYDNNFIKYDDKVLHYKASLKDVVGIESKNIAVALTADNSLEFIDLQKLKVHVTISQRRDGEWLAYTPDGYFSSSLKGQEGVFWSLGDNVLPFSAIKKDFDRPLIVQKRLQAVLKNGDIVIPPEPKVDPKVFNPPYTVMIENKDGKTAAGETVMLSVVVEKDSGDTPDPELVYYLNGRKVLKGRGFEEEPFIDEGKQKVTFRRKLQLNEGKNTIAVALQYLDSEVLRQEIAIQRKVKAKPTIVNGTQLWFFGVGVSEYEIMTQNLEYAHKDAIELSKAFKKQEGKLYSKVNTRVLTNAEATEKNIRVEMNDFLKYASSQDVIVLFVAGHGVQDNDQALYFMSHDADMKRPYTGMEIDKFRRVLDSRPINQKALLLLDICHAGTMGPRRRGRVTIDDAIQQLSDGTGTVVLASSTGSQSSLEDESFGGGHGAFTAAVLEALKGSGDSLAGDRNGFVSLQELISYTSRRVPELTEGMQHPTVPSLENVRDFPLSASDK